MAYRKVCDSQGGPLVGEPCPGALELDWDLDKEERPTAGPDLERRQTQHVDCQRTGETLEVSLLQLCQITL